MLTDDEASQAESEEVEIPVRKSNKRKELDAGEPERIVVESDENESDGANDDGEDNDPDEYDTDLFSDQPIN